MGEALKVSPLIEALCEFRFAPSSAWDWTLPGRLYEKIGHEFSKRAQVDEVAFQLHAEADNYAGSPQVIRVPQRIQLIRPDDSAIVQVGSHILVVNHLSPYPLWNNFRSLILRIFYEYVALYGEFSLSGIGLRYINQIPISPGSFDPSSFIIFKPNLTGVLDRPLSSFHQRYDILYNSPKATLIHQTGLAERDNGDVAIILDLDFDSQEVEVLKEVSELEKWLDQAHQHLYEAFIASLNPDYYQQLKKGDK